MSEPLRDLAELNGLADDELEREWHRREREDRLAEYAPYPAPFPKGDNIEEKRAA